MAGFLMRSIGAELEKRFRDFQEPMASAATTAMRATADKAKELSRQSIAAGGFGKRWTNTLQANTYPSGQDSLSPAAWVFHKINYSEIFEDGGVIDGKPMLWIPLPDVIAVSGRGTHPLKPSEWSARFGPLVSVNVDGRPPMLFPKYVAVGSRGRGKRAVTLADRRPLYIGIPTVQIEKKFDVRGACEQAAAALPGLYAANLKV